MPLALAPFVSMRPIPFPPLNTAPPGVTGTPSSGSVLTASTGTWSGSPTSYSYQWFRLDPVVVSGELVVYLGEPVFFGPQMPIAGATASTYTLQAADVGYLIGCNVTAANAGGATLAETDVVGPVTAGVSTYADAYLGKEVINAVGAGTGPWTYTFTNPSIGSADARRRVIAFACTNGGTATIHDSLIAGSVTFTKVTETAAAAANNKTSVWRATVAAGTTLPAAPVLQCSSGNPARATVHWYACGRGDEVDFAAAAAAGAVAADVPNNGLAIAFSQCTTNPPVPIAGWTGVTPITKDDDSTLQASTLYNSSVRYINTTGSTEAGKSFDPAWSGTAANIRTAVITFGAQV